MTEPKMLFRQALKETHSRLYRVLSSFSGDACDLNLGKNRQNHSIICSWIHQGERLRLNLNRKPQQIGENEKENVEIPNQALLTGNGLFKFCSLLFCINFNKYLE